MIDRWVPVKDGDPRAAAIYRRHYSARRRPTGPFRNHFAGPGFKIVLLTPLCDALFVWRKFRSMDDQEGVSCAVFRNEGRSLSSDLILSAETWAVDRWPGERLYTYVDGRSVASVNPGYCFLRAGWRRCGRSKGGLVILEKHP